MKQNRLKLFCEFSEKIKKMMPLSKIFWVTPTLNEKLQAYRINTRTLLFKKSNKDEDKTQAFNFSKKA